MSTTTKTPPLAWFYLILMALVWGSSFILMKKASAVYSITEIGAGRLFIASLFFIPIMFKTKGQIPKNRLSFLFISAMLGFVIPAFLFAIAIMHLNSSLSGMLNSLSPLFTLVIGILFFGMPKNTFQIGGIVLGLIGALILIFANNTGSTAMTTDNSQYLYASLILMATILYGTNTNNIVRNLSHLPALAGTATTFMFIGPITFVILLTTDFFSKIINPNCAINTLYLVLLGVFGSGVAAILYNKVVQMVSGLFATSVTYLIPIVAIGWGVLDNEVISLQHYIGMAVILTGIYLVNKKQNA
jgi:drug/metabolite transporter (DMT)-like permease